MHMTHRWLDRCINHLEKVPVKYGYDQTFFPIVASYSIALTADCPYGTYSTCGATTLKYICSKEGTGLCYDTLEECEASSGCNVCVLGFCSS